MPDVFAIYNEGVVTGVIRTIAFMAAIALIVCIVFLIRHSFFKPSLYELLLRGEVEEAIYEGSPWNRTQRWITLNYSAMDNFLLRIKTKEERARVALNFFLYVKGYDILHPLEYAAMERYVSLAIIHAFGDSPTVYRMLERSPDRTIIRALLRAIQSHAGVPWNIANMVEDFLILDSVLRQKIIRGWICHRDWWSLCAAEWGIMDEDITVSVSAFRHAMLGALEEEAALQSKMYVHFLSKRDRLQLLLDEVPTIPHGEIVLATMIVEGAVHVDGVLAHAADNASARIIARDLLERDVKLTAGSPV